MYNHIAANRNRTIFLMVIFFTFFVLLGLALSYYLNDQSILWFAVIFSVFMNWFSYFYSDSIALRATGARPAKKDVHIEERQLINLVDNLAITAGLPAPRVYVIDDPSPNAFATGRNPKHATVTVTTGLMTLLDKSEIEGVIAHELSHVKNYDILLSTIVVTLVGAITLLGDMFVRTNLFRSSGENHKNNPMAILALVFIILSPLFAQLIQLAVSRKREFLADASGSLLTRYPEGLASALEKIEQAHIPLKRANRATAHLFIANPFTKVKMASLFSTHPPTSERIKALREMNL